jgi:hypothetical protein
MEGILEVFQNYIADLICAGLLVLGLLCISGIHFYWTAGGRKGIDAAVPTERGQQIFQPTAGATFFIAFFSLLFAAVIPGSIGLYADAEPAFLYSWAPWILVVVFSLRALGDFRYVGLFKRVVDTRFAKMDSAFYTPFSLLMALWALVVAI